MSENSKDSTVYDFNAVIDRKSKYATKYLEMEGAFGTNDLIPLWIADMDFKVANPITNSIRDYAEHAIYGYIYRPKSYYEEIRKWLLGKYDWKVDVNSLIFSPGVMCSMNFLIQELSKPGDYIIIQQPVYYPFANKILENDRRVAVNALKKDDSGKFVMDYEDLERIIIEEKPPLLILCNPHNPVGRVWTKEELIKLGDICVKHDVRIISDEIHSDLVFKANKHIPIASINLEFEKNTITLMAPSKTFNLAGLQTSYAICKNPIDKAILEKALGKIDLKRNNSFSLVATESAYRDGENWLNQLLSYLEENIEYVISYIEENLPQLKMTKPEATYLLWIDFSSLGLDDQALSKLMIEKAKVALSKGFDFGIGGEGYLRMNVACPRSTLKKALKQIEDSLNI
ncbi:MAG: MalY/PatB family protein [Acidaminobacteraceae bacterium]